MADTQSMTRRDAEFLLYQTEDGGTRVEVRFDGDTAWLSLGQLADLFQRDKSVISRHIKNLFDEGELARSAVVAQVATTAADGKTYQVDYYNLDVIISVGYRVKSHRGTQFRIWATQRLREYIVKVFTLDDERLKKAGGGNYFDELLARICNIRSSEKVFWKNRARPILRAARPAAVARREALRRVRSQRPAAREGEASRREGREEAMSWTPATSERAMVGDRPRFV